MSRRESTLLVIGILVGAILGLFTPQAMKSFQSSPPPSPSAEQGGIPEGHPPPEVIAELGALQAQAASQPENKEVRIRLGNAYYDMGRFDAAIKWYEEALRLDPSNINVMTDLGTSYLYTGNAEKAITLYRNSLSLDPAHPQTLHNLGVAFFSMGNFGEAIRAWETLLKAFPDYPHKEAIASQIENARAHLNEQPTPQ